MDTHGHAFWWLLWMSSMLWYATATVYITVRGASDIRQMLRRLKDQAAPRDGQDGPGIRKT